MSIRKAASLCGVSKSSVQRWLKAPSQPVHPRKVLRTRRRRYSPRVVELVKCTLEQHPFSTGIDLVHAVHKQYGLKLSLSTLQRIRKKLGFRYKLAARSQVGQRANISHPFFEDLNVFQDAIAVDESSYVSTDRPRRGWALAGERVSRSPPIGRKRVSILLATDRNGIVQLENCTGAYNSERFTQFTQKLPLKMLWM